MINLGGNLLLKGQAPHHPDGLWRIGIQDPFTKPLSSNSTCVGSIKAKREVIASLGGSEAPLKPIFHNLTNGPIKALKPSTTFYPQNLSWFGDKYLLYGFW